MPEILNSIPSKSAGLNCRHKSCHNWYKVIHATSHLAHNKIDLRNEASLDPQLPGGTPLYLLPQRGLGFAPFWSENGYRLCPFWSEFGYGFRGNTGVHERICRFSSKWITKKDSNMPIRNGFHEEIFLLSC